MRLNKYFRITTPFQLMLCCLGSLAFHSNAEGEEPKRSACRFAYLRATLAGKIVQGIAWPIGANRAEYFLPFPENGQLSQTSSPLAPGFFATVCDWLNKESSLPTAQKIAPANLLPPLPDPTNIVGVGLNYPDHKAEVDLDDLVVFPKPTKLSSAYATIHRPNGALLDWEVELAIVVRERIAPGTRITAANIATYFAGFTVANDVTDRAPIIVDQARNFTLAKSHPSFLPLGPYFVPIENFSLNEKGIPELSMELTVNGERRQFANTGSMSNSLAEIVMKILSERDREWLDAAGKKQKLLQNGSLEPGDLILTGTPGGTAIRSPKLGEKVKLGLQALLTFENPKNIFLSREYCSGKYLREGDIVSARIEHLGAQENPVVEPYTTEIPVRCDRKQEVARFLRP